MVKKNTIQFTHALLIFLFTSLWVIFSAGLIEFFKWQVESGLIIHGGIIVTAIGGAAFIIKSVNIDALSHTLSFTKTAWRYYLIAIVFAVVIWLADFWLQLFFFLDDGKNDSLAIQTDIDQFGLVSIVIASCVFAPLSEELLFRGILLKGFLNRLNPLGAIFVSSFIFAGIHFSPQDFMSLFFAATGYAFLTIKAQSIRPAVLAHLINNSVSVYYLSNFID
jgi:membrane protease YdiL (CAAX protease family)